MVIVLNLKPLSEAKAFRAVVKAQHFFCVSQPELLLGSVKKRYFRPCVYAACTVCVSTGGKFQPVSNFIELHVSTQATCSFALLIVEFKYPPVSLVSGQGQETRLPTVYSSFMF